MRHHRLLRWVVVAVLAGTAAAQERAAPLATSKPSDKVAAVKALIDQLASDTFQAREAARVALMGVKRADLGAIRDGVARSMPLAPSQLAVPREIVTPVY